MRRPVIIELFGRMCQNSPKDGSHLCGQINSKHHGQAFRHLVKGRQRFLGIRPCCIDLPATPPANTRSRWSTHLQGERKPRQEPSFRNFLKPLELAVLRPNEILLSLKSRPTVIYEACMRSYCSASEASEKEGHSVQNHSHFRFLQSHWLP